MAVISPVQRALFTALPKVHLRNVKKVNFKFDPFHENVSSIRYFMFYLSTPGIRETNPKCSVKTEVVCDRSEPTVHVQLETQQKIIFKTANLSVLELVQEYINILNKLNPQPVT